MDASSSSKCEKIAEEELEIDLIRAAMDGNVEIFGALSNELFLRKCVEENNILHIAIRYEEEIFIKAFLEKHLPINSNKLITQRNSQGNTPLHVAAEVGNIDIVKLLYDYLRSVEVNDDDEKPWRAQNSKGNTALHVSILYHNYFVAEFLLERDPGLACIVNESKEAPLHLAITQHADDVRSHENMIIDLLEKASCVASWRDAKGLTPLHRAASLDSPFNLKFTEEIISFCPQSTLVCDASGKSILHLLIDKPFSHSKIKDLLRLREICILRNHQDQDGNTPLHVAAKCNNINMAKVLLQSSVKPYVKNSDGISAMSMIQQDLFDQPLQRRSMTREESRSAYKGDIKSLLEIKRTVGIKFLASQDCDGSNFLHLLMNKTAIHHYFSSFDHCSKFLDFIKKILFFFPELVCETDQTRNTPVHILARNKDFRKTMACPTLWESSLLSKLLSICANAITKIESRGITIKKADNHGLPWVEQNADGNTPLHEAIIANNKILVLELLSYSEASARLVNKHKETPLHLLAGTGIGKGEFKYEEIMKMVNANFEALGLCDKDGLIPISRAIKAKNLNMVLTLSSVQKFGDTDGQIFWHLLLKHPSNDFVSGLLQNEAFQKLLEQKDKDGNTPLHLAIEEKCFGFVENILQTWGRTQNLSEGEQLGRNLWLLDLVRIPDNNGLTPIMRAVKADNLDLATRLCRVNPEAAKMGDTNGKTFWHFLLKHSSYKFEDVKDLLEIEALRRVLEQIDKDGNTPLHLAMKEKCFCFAQDLLKTWGSEGESSEGRRLENNQLLMDLLTIRDNDGLTPIIRALKAGNLDLATRLCCVAPEAAKIGDTDGRTIGHLLPKHPSCISANMKNLVQTEALRKVLEHKDKDGNTSLHLAIKEKCFGFVQDLLETCKSERESSKVNQWLMDFLRIPNKVGETPENLLADLSVISHELEKTLLTDHKMRGIRSSWRIPRSQLQNYMNSMNVIAALQTTITFTAAFTVPGGLIQDIGTPILIRSTAFQVFMISDVIAMCLSMMVLICLLWMVATNKRESVMIQDFALSLLLASFVATLLTFMSGVYVTISPVKPWIAITTLVLCSLLMLLLHRFMLTKLLLLLFKCRKVQFGKKMISWLAGSSNT